MADKFSDKSLVSFASLALALAHGVKGELERAIEFADHLGVQTAPTPADEMWAPSYLVWARGKLEHSRGDREFLASLFQSLQAAGLMISAGPTGFFLCDLLVAVGDYQGAGEVAGELLELAEPCGGKWCAGIARRCLGEAAIYVGSAKEAEAHLKESLTIPDSIRAENEAALARAALGRLRMKQRRWREARRHLTEALETFERLGTLIEPDRVKKDLASLPG